MMWTAATAAWRAALSGWARSRIGSAGWLMIGGEAGVVFGEVDDGVFAGDVGGGDDGELGPVDRGAKVMEGMRPRAMVERTVAPCHMPGRVMSSTYWARPRTLAGPSLRMGELPTVLRGLSSGWVSERHGRVWIRDFDIRSQG